MIQKEGAPEIFYANAIGLLSRMTRLDGKNILAIIGQLELFDSIVILLDNKFYERTGNTKNSFSNRSTLNPERLTSVSLTCNFLTFVLTLDKNH